MSRAPRNDVRRGLDFISRLPIEMNEFGTAKPCLSICANNTWRRGSESNDSCSVYAGKVTFLPNGSSYLWHSQAYLGLSALLKNSPKVGLIGSHSCRTHVAIDSTPTPQEVAGLDEESVFPQHRQKSLGGWLTAEACRSWRLWHKDNLGPPGPFRGW